MSIAEPEPGQYDGVDLDALRQLSSHASELAAKGPIPEPVYRALWAEGLKAAKGHRELLQALLMWAPAGIAL